MNFSSSERNKRRSGKGRRLKVLLAVLILITGSVVLLLSVTIT